MQKRSPRPLWVCGVVGLLCWGLAQEGRPADGDPVESDSPQALESSQDAAADRAGTIPSSSVEAHSEPAVSPSEIKAAKRVAQKYAKQAQRERAKLRDQALSLSVRIAREKAKQHARQEAQARRQVQQARARQVKFLYNKGLALYRQQAYDEAINVLQGLVLLDPAHRLVKAAQRLIAKAETKAAGVRAKLRAELNADMRGASMLELKDLLAAKRIEQEVTLKYAKRAYAHEEYDQAVELLQRILAQDPAHRQAQHLLPEVELAKLKLEERELQRRVLIDEQWMMNEVNRAELLDPPPRETRMGVHAIGASAVSPDAGAAVGLQEPISFDFQAVALGDVLDFLADAAMVSLIPSPRLDLNEARVTLRVNNLPLELALKYLVKNQGLAYRVEDGVILIGQPQEFANEALETRVFTLQHGLGPFALEVSAVQPSSVLQMETLYSLIEQTIPAASGSKLVTDQRTGSLIVTNTPDNLRRIEALVDRLDVRPIQVLIESRFVEVNLDELEQLGFEAVLTGDAALTKDGTADETQGVGHFIAKGGGFKFPSLTRETEGFNLTLEGILTGTQFEAALHMLEETKKSKTLSAPRVTTLNHQAATIRVVEEFRYPTRYEVSLVQFDINGDGDFDDAGETEFVNVPQDIQKRDIGILLHVTPSVGSDGKTITLVLAPEVSTFSAFRDLGGDVTVPEFTSSQLTTSVVIESGQTVVLGGLMKDTVSEEDTRVPILGDIPLLGALFRQRGKSKTRKNLLIFVTARIIPPRGGPTI